MRCVVAIDQSTQGTKALLLSDDAKIIAKSYFEHKQLVSLEGYISHDPMEIYENVIKGVKTLVDAVPEAEISAIGITNQRETTVAWDGMSGKPVIDAIVWQCSRAKGICKSLTDEQKAVISERTGIPASPFFPAAKMRWILENVSEARNLALQGYLCLGTIDSWLIYKLTGAYKTDVSNASRTQLMNLELLDWDDEILKMFGITRNMLPEICASDAFFGETDFGGILKNKSPILAVLGDSHAALFAQHCHDPGKLKVTYGTGSSVMMNTGSEIIRSKNGLASSVAWKLSGKTDYVLEGNINYSGAVISWLKNELGLIDSPDETEEIAFAANKSDKVYLVPAFSGLGAPYWFDDAKASIVGMSRLTGRAEIVRAALDSIGFQINDILIAMSRDSKLPIKFVAVDGGPTSNRYLMQFQSGISDTNIRVSEVSELSGIGAGFVAGITDGVFSFDMAFSTLKYTLYKQHMPEIERQSLLSGWKQAIKTVVYNITDCNL